MYGHPLFPQIDPKISPVSLKLMTFPRSPKTMGGPNQGRWKTNNFIGMTKAIPTRKCERESLTRHINIFKGEKPVF